MLPQIACKAENHYNMPFEYLCLNEGCLKNSQ